jgi:hypothetical protein
MFPILRTCPITPNSDPPNPQLPRGLLVALDAAGAASGELFVDDGETLNVGQQCTRVAFQVAAGYAYSKGLKKRFLALTQGVESRVNHEQIPCITAAMTISKIIFSLPRISPRNAAY